MEIYITTGLVIFAYLFGSISSAILICRLTGAPDPRTTGSKNPGATNVLRSAGKIAALCTLVGDALKGFLPIQLGLYLQVPAWALALTAIAAFLGHLFPLYFRFKGGKGVATFFGCIYALNWLLGLITTVIWLVTAMSFRYSSLAAIIAIGSVPILSFFLTPLSIFLALLLMSLILLYRHRDNMKRLKEGKENKINFN